jgi:hypothetical protein
LTAQRTQAPPTCGWCRTTLGRRTMIWPSRRMSLLSMRWSCTRRFCCRCLKMRFCGLFTE